MGRATRFILYTACKVRRPAVLFEVFLQDSRATGPVGLAFVGFKDNG